MLGKMFHFTNHQIQCNFLQSSSYLVIQLGSCSSSQSCCWSLLPGDTVGVLLVLPVLLLVPVHQRKEVLQQTSPLVPISLYSISQIKNLGSWSKRIIKATTLGWYCIVRTLLAIKHLWGDNGLNFENTCNKTLSLRHWVVLSELYLH